MTEHLRIAVTSTARFVAAAAIISTLVPSVAFSQDSELHSVHWAYSSYFGTGWYNIDGQRNSYVLRMTPRWNYRESSIDDDGSRTLGIYFKFPVTAGLNTFILDNPSDTLHPDNLASLSVTPGVDIEIPINQRWMLRPYASIGWGTIVDGSDSAWTYWTGIKSRFAFQSGKLNWALLNGIGYVGFTPDIGNSEDFWPLMIGLEFDYPLGKKNADGDQYLWYWHASYTTFENDLELILDDPATKPITDQWELAIALGKKDERIKIWFMNFDRLGLGFRTSSNGDLQGITFVFRSIFDL